MPMWLLLSYVHLPMKNPFQHHIVCLIEGHLTSIFLCLMINNLTYGHFFVITCVSYFQMENATSLLIFSFWNLFNGLNRANIKQKKLFENVFQKFKTNAKFLFPNEFSLWESTWRCWDSFPFIFLHLCKCVLSLRTFS